MTPTDRLKAISSARLRFSLEQVEKEEKVALGVIAKLREHRARDGQVLQQAEEKAKQTSLALCGAINRAAFGTGPGSANQALVEDNQAQTKLETCQLQVSAGERLWNVAIEAVRVEQVRRVQDVLRQIREE